MCKIAAIFNYTLLCCEENNEAEHKYEHFARIKFSYRENHVILLLQ